MMGDSDPWEEVGHLQGLSNDWWGVFITLSYQNILLTFLLVFGSMMPCLDIPVFIFLSFPLSYNIFKGRELPFHICDFSSEPSLHVVGIQ